MPSDHPASPLTCAAPSSPAAGAAWPMACSETAPAAPLRPHPPAAGKQKGKLRENPRRRQKMRSSPCSSSPPCALLAASARTLRPKPLPLALPGGEPPGAPSPALLAPAAGWLRAADARGTPGFLTVWLQTSSPPPQCHPISSSLPGEAAEAFGHRDQEELRCSEPVICSALHSRISKGV